MKKSIITLIIIGLISVQNFAQKDTLSSSLTDTTAVSKKKGPTDAGDFGLLFGLNYSQYYMSSNPFFVDSLTAMGSSEAKNKFGLTVGVFYNFKLGKKLILRPAVEATIMPSVIEYDMIRRKTESWVYPLTVEVPFYVVYGNHERENLSDKKMHVNWFAAVRPVFPLSVMSSEQPLLREFNLNGDIGCSIPFVLKSTIMKAEIFYSFGMLDLIGDDADNYKTSSITSLRRNFIGLRFFFN